MLHFTPSRTVLPLALVAAVAATFLQGAAFASPAMAPTHRTITIPVKGLDLARSKDVARLDMRIKAAAHIVCKPEDARNLRAYASRADCEKSAIADATGKRDGLVAQAQDQAIRIAATPKADPATN